MEIKKSISRETDEIRTEKIVAIRNAAGVNGVVALNFINNDKKLDVILESSKKGNITYVDDSKGSLTQASAMSFAINAANTGTNP